MTLNEKLDTISELESVGFKQNIIATIVESLDGTAETSKFASVEDFWKHLDSDEE